MTVWVALVFMAGFTVDVALSSTLGLASGGRGIEVFDFVNAHVVPSPGEGGPCSTGCFCGGRAGGLGSLAFGFSKGAAPCAPSTFARSEAGGGVAGGVGTLGNSSLGATKAGGGAKVGGACALTGCASTLGFSPAAGRGSVGGAGVSI